MSSWTESPSQILDIFALTGTAHLSSLHLPLSHSSSVSHASPSAFLPVHLPPEHVPLVHSLSDSHSSPPAFFSRHLPSVHVPLLHSSFLSHSSPPAFLGFPHPGKSGGHSLSAPPEHGLGGSWSGRLGGSPAICTLTGTVKGLLRLPDVATGSLFSLNPWM